jgi:hypothetical protein
MLDSISVMPRSDGSGYVIATFDKDRTPQIACDIEVPARVDHEIVRTAPVVLTLGVAELHALQAMGHTLDPRWVTLTAEASIGAWSGRAKPMYTKHAIFEALGVKPLAAVETTVEAAHAVMHLTAHLVLHANGWLDNVSLGVADMAGVEYEFCRRAASWYPQVWQFDLARIEADRKGAEKTVQECRAFLTTHLKVKKLATQPTHHTVAQQIELVCGVTRPLNAQGELVWTDETLMKVMQTPGAVTTEVAGQILAVWLTWRRAASFVSDSGVILGLGPDVTFDLYSPLPTGAAVSTPRLPSTLVPYIVGACEVLRVPEKTPEGWSALKRQLLQSDVSACVMLADGAVIRRG